MNEDSPHIHNEEYIYIYRRKQVKFSSSRTQFENIPPMEQLSHDHKICSNLHMISRKLHHEKGHPFLILAGSQYGGKATVEQILGSEKENKSKRVGI